MADIPQDQADEVEKLREMNKILLRNISRIYVSARKELHEQLSRINKLEEEKNRAIEDRNRAIDDRNRAQQQLKQADEEIRNLRNDLNNSRGPPPPPRQQPYRRINRR